MTDINIKNLRNANFEIAKQSRNTLNDIFMQFCEILSTRSTCARLKTAAILVKNNNIISIGYNGSCPGAQHCDDYWKENQMKYYVIDFDEWIKSDLFYEEHHKFSTKYELHAEMNAITNAAKNKCSSKDTTMFSLYAPCIQCAKLIVASKIKKVVFKYHYDREQEGLNFLVNMGIDVEEFKK